MLFRSKRVYLVLSMETRLALKLLGVVYNKTMSGTIDKLIMKAYSEEKISIPKGKMTKIRKLVKKWKP